MNAATQNSFSSPQATTPRKVLLTGGNGFIGAWILRRLLADGLAVRVIDLAQPGAFVRSLLGDTLAKVEWQCGDVSQADFVHQAAQGCDAAVHFAGVLTPFCKAHPIRGAQINVLGTLNVFEAARAHGLRKVVYASSAGVFGPTHANYPEPTTHYGAFKLANEACARSYWEDAQIASVGFRPFVVYGPGREDGASAGVSLACRAAAIGQPYAIPMSGSAGMVHVDDVVDAFMAALTRTTVGAHVFNLCGATHSVDELVTEILHQVPTAQLRIDGSPLQIASELPPDDLDRVLPGLRHTNLRDGVSKTIAHYSANAASKAIAVT